MKIPKKKEKDVLFLELMTFALFLFFPLFAARCLCATRWKEAFDAGVAPPVDLQATNQAVLYVVISFSFFVVLLLQRQLCFLTSFFFN